MRRPLAIAAALLLLAAPAAADDAAVLDPRVTQETLAETVCVHGYTRSVRPGWRWARAMKDRALAAVGLGPEARGAYQLDHRMPLVLGGAARDPANLTLQESSEARIKDGMERRLGCLVCKGELLLEEARLILTGGDWRQGWSEWKRVRCRRK